MRSRFVAGLLLCLVCTAPAASGQTACKTWISGTGQAALPLPVPAGFTEICAQDAVLCGLLTRGFPPSVTTVGYFVPDAEWAGFRGGTVRGFRQYLIAQVADGLQPSFLPALKMRLHAQQGTVPDHSRLPDGFESRGRAPLGVFDETNRSVSFGIVLRMQPPHLQGTEATDTVVATNSAVVVGERVLSLYVYQSYTTAADVAVAKQRTREWVRCILASQPVP